MRNGKFNAKKAEKTSKADNAPVYGSLTGSRKTDPCPFQPTSGAQEGHHAKPTTASRHIRQIEHHPRHVHAIDLNHLKPAQNFKAIQPSDVYTGVLYQKQIKQAG
jgi:histidine ammonia-lyase